MYQFICFNTAESRGKLEFIKERTNEHRVITDNNYLLLEKADLSNSLKYGFERLKKNNYNLIFVDFSIFDYIDLKDSTILNFLERIFALKQVGKEYIFIYDKKMNMAQEYYAYVKDFLKEKLKKEPNEKLELLLYDENLKEQFQEKIIKILCKKGIFSEENFRIKKVAPQKIESYFLLEKDTKVLFYFPKALTQKASYFDFRALTLVKLIQHLLPNEKIDVNVLSLHQEDSLVNIHRTCQSQYKLALKAVENEIKHLGKVQAEQENVNFCISGRLKEVSEDGLLRFDMVFDNEEVSFQTYRLIIFFADSEKEAERIIEIIENKKNDFLNRPHRYRVVVITDKNYEELQEKDSIILLNFLKYLPLPEAITKLKLTEKEKEALTQAWQPIIDFLLVKMVTFTEVKQDLDSVFYYKNYIEAEKERSKSV